MFLFLNLWIFVIPEEEEEVFPASTVACHDLES
jgi:hypothetical protein